MRYLTKVIWIQGLLDFALSAYFIFITWGLYEQTENIVYTGLFVGLGFLPSLLCMPFFGVFVDRYHKKYLLLAAFATIFITIAAVMICFDDLSPILLIVSNMVLQLCGSLIRPAMQAYISALFNKEQLIVTFQKSASYTIIGGILGTAISSFFITQAVVSILAFTIINAIFIALSLLWRLPKDKLVIYRSRYSIFKEMRAGFTYCLSSCFFLQLLIIMMIGQLIYHTTVGFLAAYTYEVLKSNATLYGLLEITLSISGVLAGLLGTKYIKNFKQFSPIIMMVGLMLSLLLLALDTTIAFTVIGCAGIGFCTTWIRTTFQAIQQIATAQQYHGRAASIRMFFNQGCIVCLTPIFGVLAERFSAHSIFFLLASISVIGLFLCSTQQVRKQF
ncbi:MFS transporter [Metasolibacillus meyeri]|uniref:MFS transporter n=1 Tax=Metasolibacillus meyeri TaxID=1071052 RepID=UPI00187D1796|nr:MFS transporter [Metasolibacillus meyeri]